MIIYDPERLSSWIEGLLNNDVQSDIDESEKLTFKVDTLFGKFDTNFLLNINNTKTKYVYSIITDPTGTMVPIKDLGISHQQFVLHMFFKISQRKYIYRILQNLMILLAGNCFEIPGTSGDSIDYISTNTAYPLVGDADPHSIKSVNERNGLIQKQVDYYTDATITIYLSTGLSTQSNKFKCFLNEERVYILNEIGFSVGKMIDSEQYKDTANTVSTASATEKGINLSFYLKAGSVLEDKLLRDSLYTLDDYNQNEIYTFKISYDDINIERKVLIKNLRTTTKIGDSITFSCELSDADRKVLE